MRPLQPKQVWSIRARLELAGNRRDLALFNLAVDSKLRGCDLVPLRVADLVVGDAVREPFAFSNRPLTEECPELWNDPGTPIRCSALDARI